MAASANGVVLLTFRTSGTASAAKNARMVEQGLIKAGAGGTTGSKGMLRFSGGLQTMVKRTNAGASAAKNLLGAFAGFAILQKGTQFLKEAARAALDDAGGQRRLTVALKNSTGATAAQNDAVESWITKVATATGVADDDLRPAFQKLVESTGSISAAQDQLSLAMDASTGTGKSLLSVTAAMAKANKGNTTGLSRLGIATKDAKGHTLSATAAFAKMGKLFGGQMKTQTESAEGKMLRLTNQMDEARETIGYKLMPVFTKALKWILKYAVPWLLSLIDAWNNNIGVIGKLRKALEVVGAIFMTVFGWIGKHQQIVKDLALGIGIAVVAIWLWTAAQAAINAVMAINPIFLIIIAIGLLVAAIVWLVQNWTGVTKWVKQVWNGFIHWFGGVLVGFAHWWTGVWDGITGLFQGIWHGLILWVAIHFVIPLFRAFRGIKQWWAGLWSGIGDTFGKVWTGIGILFHGAANGILGGLQTFVNKAIDIINGITGGVSLAWTWIPGTEGIPKIPHVKLPKLATGGDVTAGSPYIVGDGGRPEMFVPGSDGHVFPRVPSMAGISAADISASLDDVTVGTGMNSGGQQVFQLVLPDGSILFEWILNEAGAAEARH